MQCCCSGGGGKYLSTEDRHHLHDANERTTVRPRSTEFWISVKLDVHQHILIFICFYFVNEHIKNMRNNVKYTQKSHDSKQTMFTPLTKGISIYSNIISCIYCSKDSNSRYTTLARIKVLTFVCN